MSHHNTCNRIREVVPKGFYQLFIKCLQNILKSSIKKIEIHSLTWTWIKILHIMYQMQNKKHATYILAHSHRLRWWSPGTCLYLMHIISIELGWSQAMSVCVLVEMPLSNTAKLCPVPGPLTCFWPSALDWCQGKKDNHSKMMADIGPPLLVICSNAIVHLALNRSTFIFHKFCFSNKIL